MHPSRTRPDSRIVDVLGVLKMAQASGDRQALLEANRRVLRFHLQMDAVRHHQLADFVR
jgi:hypothetical protein